MDRRLDALGVRTDAASDAASGPTHAPVTDQAVDGARVLRIPAGEVGLVARDAVGIASEADSVVITAATEIVLSVGRSTLTLRADGTILLNGERMTLNAPGRIDLNPDPAPVREVRVGRPPRPCGCDDADGAA